MFFFIKGNCMKRTNLRPMKSIHATRESDGAVVKVLTFLEVAQGNSLEAGGCEVESRKVYKLAGQMLRVDEEDVACLSNGTDRFKPLQPL